MVMTEKANTILIVDDDPVNLRLMERLLHHEYNVVTANDGSEALEILGHQDISLIMSDQMMPRMTGIELLRASQAINPDVVRMLVTARTDNDISIEAINDAGVVRVIHKPFDRQLVLQFVKSALAQRQTLMECRQANTRIEQVISKLKRDTEKLNPFAALARDSK
jgi:response regulator RpfG family c-di-GMP phosphodiesterase